MVANVVGGRSEVFMAAKRKRISMHFPAALYDIFKCALTKIIKNMFLIRTCQKIFTIESENIVETHIKELQIVQFKRHIFFENYF